MDLYQFFDFKGEKNMKYFTSELWAGMQDSCIQDETERRWDKNAELYASYFSSIRERLPKGFLKIFDRECGFHDFTIEKINLSFVTRKTMPNAVCVTILITNGENRYQIIIKNVDISNINIIDKSYCIRGRLSWGYTEFELLENKKIELRILCDIYNELTFVFDKISIKKL